MSKAKKVNRNDCAVYVRHAWKTYKKPNYVFTGLHMTMMKGSIYALLGASGCGKTTLLSCIVGIRYLDSGEIWVLGGKPGSRGSGVPGNRVGYMPQETALYGDFTIKETMLYFGWICGLRTKEIKDRIAFLVKFLELPTAERQVKSLSGGEQRRVSLGAAMLHTPELLILDEPTVGVDPILRANIWNYLVLESKERNCSIIITTHYIEEAKQAQTIGIMRSGQLLAEEAPLQLLQVYGCPNLEEVFLKLSRAQDAAEEPQKAPSRSEILAIKAREEDDEKAAGGSASATTKEQHGCCYNFCLDLRNLTSFGRLRALMTKNTLRLVRNIGGLLFIFALPVIQAILFCICIGHDPKDLTLAIVNKEVNYTNLTYLHCPSKARCYLENGIPKYEMEHLSCHFLPYLEGDIIRLQYYPDVDSCQKAVRNGSAWGCLYFNSNFTGALVERMEKFTALEEEVLYLSEIQVWLDKSNQQIDLTIERKLDQALTEFAVDILKDCFVNPHLIIPPVVFREPIYGQQEPSFTDFSAPGVLLTIVFFLAISLTASSLIMERTEGLLDRSHVSGVNLGEILFCHVVVQFFVMVGQTILALIFMILVFEVDCVGNISLVVILTVLQGLCGMCFGFIISSVCTQERNAVQLALGSFYPVLLLSGIIWPTEAMPYWLRRFSVFLPLTLATTALRAIMLRGWGIEWPEVYWGYIATCIWIVIFLILSMLILKFKRG